eukprot:TRINITY_DN6172_c0_g1_i1.p1 TRINITY_DN6172_c0_g1~~TRINITY_DN6172_c0_g1_i1.p1  ORF type:complete len:544 (-),score=246.40 TRINITY_DN6172_c0_g1_i1:85-1578(-)
MADAKHFLRGDVALLDQPRVRTRGQAKISDTLNHMIDAPEKSTRKRKADAPPHTLTKEEQDRLINEFKMVFRLFDQNRDGSIEKDELVKVIHSMGKRATQKRLNKIFAEADKDKNGTIDREEFVAYMLKKHKAKLTETATSAKKGKAPAKKETPKKAKKETPKEAKKEAKETKETKETKEDDKKAKTKEDDKKEKKQDAKEKEEAETKNDLMKRGVSITNFYTEYAGLNDEIEAEKVDEHSNPVGREFDLGREGAFTNHTILVGLFCPFSVMTDSIFEGTVGKALRSKGFDLNIVTKHEEFITQLEKETTDQAWIISSSTLNTNPEFTSALEKFHKTGRGIAFWADNRPWFGDVNPVTKKLFNVELAGDTPGGKVLTLGDIKDSGKFARHLLTSGISKLFEGITISYPQELESSPLLSLATSTDGKPCVLYGDYEQFGGKFTSNKVGRVLVDVGFTKLYNNWDTAGTDRYVRNVAVWLLALDHRFINGYALQGPIRD